MKFYYYLIISVGIMLMMGLAGVQGIGNYALGLFISDGEPIQPTIQYNGSVTDNIADTTSDIINGQVTFFVAVLVGFLAIIAFGVLAGVQVLGSSISVDAPTIIRASIASLCFSMFTSDMWSVVTLVFSYGTDWISWFLFTIVAVYCVGFAISALEFVGGSD